MNSSTNAAEGGKPNDAVARIKGEIVTASKILLRHGIVDGFGHVSVRHPEKPGVFLMSKRVPPALVGVGDIVEHGFDGEQVHPDGSPLFLERYIHSEIFAARPDVHAVVHSHSPAIVAFGIVPSLSLRAVCNTCGFLKGGAPLFEMRAFGGDDTNLMITSRELGRNLVDVLGDKSVVLMRGHGSTVVGASIGQAVYRAVYTEANAGIQAAASQMGDIMYLSDGEADACEAINDKQVERAWQFWKAEI